MNTQQLVSQLQSRIDRRGNYISKLEDHVILAKKEKDRDFRDAMVTLCKRQLKATVQEQVLDKKLMDNLHEQQFQERFFNQVYDDYFGGKPITLASLTNLLG